MSGREKTTTRNRASEITKAEYRALALPEGFLAPYDDYLCAACGWGFFPCLEVSCATSQFKYCPGCGLPIEGTAQ